MGITSHKVSRLGIAFLLGGFWIGVGHCLPAAAQEYAAAAPVAHSAEKDLGQPVYSPPGRFWLRADYLMWWTSGMKLPSLVTTSPQGTPQPDAGVLPGATVLYGDQTVNADARSGVRTTLGMWLDAERTWDLELDYLTLGEQSSHFRQISLGDPILARPFYNVQTGLQASQLVAYPGLVTGTITVDAKEIFQSAGGLFGYKLLSSDSGDPGQNSIVGAFGAPLLYGNRTDVLAGFRYYNLGDRLGVVEDRRLTQVGPLQNTTFLIHDNFRANNDFYGGELGFRTRIYRGRWSLEILGKMAAGNTHQTVTIDGQTVVTTPNQPTQTYDAGTLAVGTNSRTYQRNDFSVIPQLGLELGCQVNRNWRAYVGYNVLYWGCVLRAADQIDLNVDPRNFPPPQTGATAFPAFPEKRSAFWAQGANVGAEFRF